MFISSPSDYEQEHYCNLLHLPICPSNQGTDSFLYYLPPLELFLVFSQIYTDKTELDTAR